MSFNFMAAVLSTPKSYSKEFKTETKLTTTKKYDKIMSHEENKQLINVEIIPGKELSLVAQMVKNLPAIQKTRVRFLGREDSLEKEMTTHSSILAWRIPWTEESGRL